MRELNHSTFTMLKRSSNLSPAEPLWKRAPTRDDEGRPLSDFMMILPHLSQQPDQRVKRKLQVIEMVLGQYQDAVIFAEVNLKLNTLWVTVKPVPGICLELAAAIKVQIPEALLVAQKQE